MANIFFKPTAYPSVANSDDVTITDKVTKKFSDLDLDFVPHPSSGDIVPLTDSAAIKRAVRNILLTAYNERLFNPEFGSGIRQTLFEPMNPATKQTLRLMITNTIKVFEPRATLINLDIAANEEENGYRISITFAIDNISEVVDFEMFLERIR